MAQASSQADHVPRELSNVATRAASLGLAGVVLCLAAFSIFGAYSVQTQLARAQHQDSLHTRYDLAIFAIQAEDASVVEFLLDPTTQRRAAMNAATNEFIDAMNEIEVYGGDVDSLLVNDVMAIHNRYVGAAAQVIEAFDAGHAAEARRIELEDADPIFESMRTRIEASSDVRAAQASAAFGTLQATARWLLLESPVVFAVGFGLLFILWRILADAERATRKTYREIEQLSRLRSEFVSIVSHEFRTPLTGIQGFSEMMRDENMSLPEMREYAGDINKDARRLARLITDMLDLDRMESGRMTLNSVAVDLNRIVVDTAALFRLSAADHPIHLDLDTDLPELQSDPDRLTQVVTNLVSNAIKYSPSGGAVELRTEQSADAVTLTVTDHGMGIATEQLEKIFDRYSRVENAETRSIQGTGLGLPIVRQIVQLCKGRVWATSESGEGSVFHVELPLQDTDSLVPLAG
jgi:signal transduction histidine kinase